MNIPKVLRSALLSLSLLYALVSGFGMAAMGTMPRPGTPACAMLGHMDRMCPMSAADHFASWESAFRALPERQQALPIIALAFLGSVTWLLVNKYQPSLQGRTGKRKWPPGYLPLFIRTVSMGAHQRLTYG